MKNLLQTLFLGKNDRFGAVIAFGIIALVALGCTCGDKFDLSDLANKDNSNRSSNRSTTPFDDKDDDTDTDGIPSQSAAESMVKDTTEEFAKAVNSGDFSTLYNNASSDFQSTYTEEQTKNVFKAFIDKKRIVVPILEKADGMSAEFMPLPHTRTEQGLTILVLNGKFATKPVPLRFEYEYVKRGGEWKLLKLIVKLT